MFTIKLQDTAPVNNKTQIQKAALNTYNITDEKVLMNVVNKLSNKTMTCEKYVQAVASTLGTSMKTEKMAKLLKGCHPKKKK